MYFDGFKRNEQFVCNLLVLEPLGEQFHDIKFAIRQGIDQGLGTGGRPIMVLRIRHRDLFMILEGGQDLSDIVYGDILLV